MQNWFISWQLVDKDRVGYQVFSSALKDPAEVLSEQVKLIAEKEGVNPFDIAVSSFNKV